MDESQNKPRILGEPVIAHSSDTPLPTDIPVAPEPAGDDAVKEALDVAESVGSLDGDPWGGLGMEADYSVESISLNSIIDEAERRSGLLFEQSSSEVHEPHEELDALEIAAQFGRPSDEPASAIDELNDDFTDAFNETKNLSPRRGLDDDGVMSASGFLAAPLAAEDGDEVVETPRNEPIVLRSSRPVDGGYSMPQSRIRENRVGAEPGSVYAQDEVAGAVKAVGTGAADTSPLVEPRRERFVEIREMLAKKTSAVNEGTYFEILELPLGATDEDVKNAYQSLLSRFDEDLFAEPELADMKKEAALVRAIVTEAYEVLATSDLRERYRRASEEGCE